jgi:hypothetical protein
MPTKKRILEAMAHAKEEIGELVAHYRTFHAELQRNCSHTIVYAHFPSDEAREKHRKHQTRVHIEYRICSTCGKEERIVHGPSIMKELDHEGHDRVFPTVKYGPFKEISRDVLREIRNKFSPFPDEE